MEVLLYCLGWIGCVSASLAMVANAFERITVADLLVALLFGPITTAAVTVFWITTQLEGVTIWRKRK